MSTFLTVILTIIAIISAILLIGIILIQQNKAKGGLGAVSGGMTESMFGASASNVLTKGTTWLAVIFLVSTLLLASITGKASTKSSLENDNEANKIAEAKVAEQKAEDEKKAAEAKAAAEKAEAERKASAEKAEAEKKVAETKPADAAKPAETKPADAAKPAETKPADAAKPAAEAKPTEAPKAN